MHKKMITIGTYAAAASILALIVLFAIAIVTPGQPAGNTKMLLGVGGVIAMAVLVVAIFISGGAATRQRKEILQNGISAEALILAIHKTSYSSSGGTSNVRLELEVHPEGGMPYRAESSLQVGVGDPKLVFRVNSIIQVFINPEDPSHIEVPDPESVLGR